MEITRRVVLALAMASIVLCSWLAPLDAPALQQVDAGMKRALVSFATARALNAVISVVQGTELAVQPAGVGVILTPGQVLEPINDLVEDFSNLMLAACVAFGVQKVLIGIGGFWLVSLILKATTLAWTVLHFSGRRPPAWLSKMLVVLLMLRFAIPVATIGSDLVWQQFLAADYATSQQSIDTASSQAAKLNPPSPAASENQGWLERIKEWTSKNADVKARFDAIRLAAEQATEHIIKLMVIFLLHTLVMPLLLLWALYGVVRGVFEMPSRPSMSV